MSVKIQIASLAALERLLGNDSEVEFEIRQSVAENFAKKHLKAIASDAIMQAKERTILDAVTRELFTNGPKDYWGNPRPVLKSELTQPLRTLVQEEIYTVARQVVSEVLEVEVLKEKLRKLSDNAVKDFETDWNSAQMQRRIDAEVDKRIKSKLGLQ